jgi:transcriptional regulatory protein LEU3
MISSRYYKKRPDAYLRLMEIAKKLAGEAIINMTQSIEHCQGFILLASYPAPDRKYSENKNWLYSGVAFRYVVKAIYFLSFCLTS